MFSTTADGSNSTTRCWDKTPRALTTNSDWLSQTAPASATASGLRTTPTSTSFNSCGSLTAWRLRVPGTPGTAEQTTFAVGNSSAIFARTPGVSRTANHLPPIASNCFWNEESRSGSKAECRISGRFVKCSLYPNPETTRLPVRSTSSGRGTVGRGRFLRTEAKIESRELIFLSIFEVPISEGLARSGRNFAVFAPQIQRIVKQKSRCVGQSGFCHRFRCTKGNRMSQGGPECAHARLFAEP